MFTHKSNIVVAWGPRKGVGVPRSKQAAVTQRKQAKWEKEELSHVRSGSTVSTRGESLYNGALTALPVLTA